jgi:hypothetical protein
MSNTRTQARLRPVIRVFVSSTFSDMKHERNALEADIPAAEFKALSPQLPSGVGQPLVQTGEDHRLPRPDGAGPDNGVYVLQSRAGAGNWANKVEGPLGAAVRRAARPVGFSETVRRNCDPSGNMCWRSSGRCELRTGNRLAFGLVAYPCVHSYGYAGLDQ